MGRVSSERGFIRRGLANERGVALVITLFIVALVTVLVLEYHFEASVEIDLAANYARDVQAYHLAVAGVNFARALLKRDDGQIDGANDTWFQTQFVPCMPPQQLLTFGEAADAAGLTFDNVPPAPSAAEPDATEAEVRLEGCIGLRITDEQSKLPLNALRPAAQEEEPNPLWQSIFAEFFRSFQIEEDTLGALVDWIDANDTPSGLGGAESSYYEGLEKPYKAPNNPLRTPGELRLIRGMSNDTLARLFPGLLPEAMPGVDIGSNTYLTVFGDAQNGKINVNTANAEVLQAVLGGIQGGASSALNTVNDILIQREEAPFEQLNEVNLLIPDSAVHAQLAQVADVKSRFFRVEVTAMVDVVQKRAIAVFERQQQEAVALVYFKVE